jgi:DNA-binding winged helix-turn-helix (wHTH) protein
MSTFVFEPFTLDPARRRLTKSGEPVAISERQFDVLLRLIAQAGQVIAKDDLISAGWQDVAVADNSLEQAISALRRVLAGGTFIETVPRRGYRFVAPVQRRAARQTDGALEALLAPHRAFVEGRAALETLEAGQIARALDVFEGAVAAVPESASAHLGLANACLMRFETTRADPAPDVSALTRAIQHARDACRLEPASAEAWATLGFVLARTAHRVDALAAANRAASLEPDNWRHHFRLAYVSWGEARLRAAHRALALLPGFPLAHWLAATVYVARQALDEAERELAAGVVPDLAHAKFGAVALHWLRGLVLLARGDETGALAAFDQELAGEGTGHLYSRECCANTWYAIGAVRTRQGRTREATDAFGQALNRIADHPLALAALSRDLAGTSDPQARALAAAIRLSVGGAHADAARSITDALAAADEGNAFWLLPVEPLLHVNGRPDVWARPLARLRSRAA